ncbi:MAG: DUF1922 domain-containing protein [Candidatus Hermodarchaeota archaeon]
MQYLQKFYFFRCYHCGQWFYSNRIIKVKKCLKCAKTFQFKNSTKFSKQCTSQDAITIIKKLKKNELNAFLNKDFRPSSSVFINFKVKS